MRSGNYSKSVIETLILGLFLVALIGLCSLLFRSN